MERVVCPKCGMRYLPVEPLCPGCSAPRRAGAPAVAPSAHPAAPALRRRDYPVAVLHAVLAAFLVWAVLAWPGPRWPVAMAALDVAIAVGALARWRWSWLLSLLRNGLLVVLAGVLFTLELGNPVFVMLLVAHAGAAWVFFRASIGRGAGAVPIAAGPFAGVPVAASVAGEVARGGARSEAQIWMRALAAPPALLTWIPLVPALLKLVRGG